MLARSRPSMPAEGRQLREALYRDGHKPSLVQKIEVYKAMQAQVAGIEWYEHKTHLNWCSGKEKKLKLNAYPGPANGAADADVRVYAAIKAEMDACPNPTLSDMAVWAHNLNLPGQLVREMAAYIAGVL